MLACAAATAGRARTMTRGVEDRVVRRDCVPRESGEVAEPGALRTRRRDLGCRIVDVLGAHRRMRCGGRGGSCVSADWQVARADLRPAAARAAWLLDLHLHRSAAEGSRPLDRMGARDSICSRDRQAGVAAVVRRLQERHLELRVVGAPDGFAGPRRHLPRRLLPRLSARLSLRAVADGNRRECDRRGGRDAPDDRRGPGDGGGLRARPAGVRFRPAYRARLGARQPTPRCCWWR